MIPLLAKNDRWGQVLNNVDTCLHASDGLTDYPATVWDYSSSLILMGFTKYLVDYLSLASDYLPILVENLDLLPLVSTFDKYLIYM